MTDEQDWLRNNDLFLCSLINFIVQHIFSSKTVLTKLSSSSCDEEWFYLYSRYMQWSLTALISQSEMHEIIAIIWWCLSAVLSQEDFSVHKTSLTWCLNTFTLWEYCSSRWDCTDMIKSAINVEDFRRRFLYDMR